MSVTVAQLETIKALSHLPQTSLEKLAGLMIPQTYAPGELNFIEDEPTEGMWYIFEGQVKVMKQSSLGRIQALCLVDKKRCFGSCPLFTRPMNPASAQAHTDVTLFILPANAATQLVDRDPALARVLLEIYGEYITLLSCLSEKLGAWRVAGRLNDALLNYAVPHDPYPIVRLTHEQLAELVGTVREVVSRHLLQLEQQGLILVEKGLIHLVHPERLDTMLPCAKE